MADLSKFFQRSGLSVGDTASVVGQCAHPGYGVTTTLKLCALSDADIDQVLKGAPLGTRALVKKAVKSSGN